MGAWARVEGTPTPVGSHSTTIIKNGVKVQSITILGKECAVGDEVRVQNCICLPYKELKRVCYSTFFILFFLELELELKATRETDEPYFR